MKPTFTRILALLGRLGLLFLCSLFVVQYPLSVALAQPPAPHDTEQDGVSYDDCVYCHHSGRDGAPLAAVDHIRYNNADCRVCHGTTGTLDAAHISHPIVGWKDCRGCHDRWANEDVEIPNLADSDYDHTIYESSTCTSCHPVAGDYYDGIPPAACGVCHPESTSTETVHNGPENWVDCVECHEAAGHYPHDQARMRAQDESCIACHYERKGHWASDVPTKDRRYSLSTHVARDDPHMRVDCTACHLQAANIERDPTIGRIYTILPETEEGVPPDNPKMGDVDRIVDCYQRCHFVNNTITAPAAELPSRGVICLSCHSASLVIQDNLSWTGIAIFGVGVLMAASSRGLIGSKRRSQHSPVASFDFATLPRIVWLFVADGLLRRELFRKDKVSWLAYACVLFGIAMRMALAVFTWFMILLAPTVLLTRILVDKNAPITTLVYDGLGLLIIAGAILSLLRRYIGKNKQAVAKEQDTVTVALIVAIFVVGFVVKGARISIADLPPNLAAFSFIGYPVSLLLRRIPANWGIVYGWLWYVHAGLVAALVAYTPFSKFMRALFSPDLAT